MDINAKRQERAGLAKQARDILTAAENDGGRNLTAEESTKFDRLMEQVDGCDAQIEREEKLRAKERRIDDEPGDQPGRGDDDRDGGERNGPDGGGDVQMRAFRQYLLGGRASLSPEQARTLIAGSDPEGGYLVAPQQFVTELVQAVDDAVQLRGLATVHRLTEAASLGIPTLDTDMNDAEWTSEVGTGSQDDALRLGKRELTPNPLAKRTKISRKLLRLTANRAENLVRERLAYKFAVSEEKAYMVGDGNKKPLGVFTASSAGIPTSRDVEIGTGGAIPTAAGSFTVADQLIDAKYALKAAYWRRARWLYHRDLVKTIRKLKTTDGQYIWKAGLSDQPDTILEVPYVVSEYAPNTITANGYVGMIADFSFYHIADALNLEIQRLVELYAEANQVGFIGRREVDGMPVLAEAFVRLKVKA
ncbi:phage major capsid protein [Micromonospora aurantiaca (nom. illeg.)]|uniref:phage major capsid protein n=1 Tax=Micromonospora aurantiaca (nom. illeg.) TaxID=47850 RepID=UPI001656D372|nr:phage major capsid protein [Micromonospora aurantiaca]MBC9001282.1 phage major capsid protein [Micromonospora aurantiaca]